MYKWIVDTHLVCEEFVAAGARVLPPALALTGRGRREEAAPRYPGKRQGDEGPHPSIRKRFNGDIAQFRVSIRANELKI